MRSGYAQQDPIEKTIQGGQKEIETYCKNVTPGEGRLYDCLEKNQKMVSQRYQQAVKDAGITRERPKK